MNEPTDLDAAKAELADLRSRIEFMEWQAQSLSTFAKIMQHARLILFSMNQSGTTTMSDGKGLELLGLKPGERLGCNELDATKGTPVHDHLLRALRGEEVRGTVESAPGVFFDTWYMPLRNENNELDGVLSLSVDATDRVLSERQIIQNTKVIAQQSETIRDLAAPVIKVWHEVLCMPISAAVDAKRAAEMMDHLLESVVKEKARFVILDMTGVIEMDTATVQNILRIFGAARTLGVKGVLSGVQPAVAQSLVSVGVNLDDLRTARTLHDALAWCLQGATTRSGPQPG